jgi:TonB family protein
MARQEKFGKFVLLEEVDSSAVGSEYRAAKLCLEGLESIVSVVRLSPAISARPEAARVLLDEAKAAAQVQNPNAVKLLGVGKVDASYYLSYEFLEGKSLKATLAHVRRDAFPFAVDHALLIASRACAALEPVHDDQGRHGAPGFHGLLTPDNVVLTYEGQIRLRGFGYWPHRRRESDGLGSEDRHYLSPEQAAGGPGDRHSDTFAVGALLYEMLTGQPLFADGHTDDPAEKLASAKLWNPRTGDDELPSRIADILRRALAADPAARYAEIPEMRKALGSLLSSGAYNASAFSLTFFMHSVFRDDIMREARNLREERKASYLEFLAEPSSRSEAVSEPVYAGAALPLTKRLAPETPGSVTFPKPPPSLPPMPKVLHPVGAPLETRPAPPVIHASAAPARVSTPAPTRGTTDSDLHRRPGRNLKPLMAGLAGLGALIVLLTVGGWLLLQRRATPPAPAPPAPNQGETAAMQRIKELEQRLATIEQEKVAAAARAAEDARKKLEAQAAAHGRVVDARALARAEDDARRKAQQELEAKTQLERRRLEEEQKAVESQLSEERRRAAEVAASTAAAPPSAAPAETPPPTLAAAPAPPPPPAVVPGTLVGLDDPGVIGPVAAIIPPLRYPPLAERLRREGTVNLNILVDENGYVVDATIVNPAGGRSGFDEAALDNVKKRLYRPATKDGVPVKVWFPVAVRFVLAKG